MTGMEIGTGLDADVDGPAAWTVSGIGKGVAGGEGPG